MKQGLSVEAVVVCCCYPTTGLHTTPSPAVSTTSAIKCMLDILLLLDVHMAAALDAKSTRFEKVSNNTCAG